MKVYSFNIKVVMKVLLYILIVYPFFKTYYFSELGVMPYVNQILFALALGIIGLFYVLKLPYIKLNGGIYFILIYYVLILVSSIMGESFDSEYFSLIAFSVGFALLVNYCLEDKNELLYFLSAIYLLLYIYVLVNLFLIVLYPNGIPSITSNALFPQYLFGNTNSVIKYVLPGLCFSFLYDLLKYKKIRKRSWLLLIMVWVTLLITSSITSLLGLFLFTFMLLNKIGTKQPFFNYLITLLISFVLFMVFVVWRNQSDLLANILGWFGKSITFSNRDTLWMNAIESFKYSPIWGYGNQTSDFIYAHIGNRHGSHNYYLDTLFRGGIISLCFMFMGLIYSLKKISKCRNNYVTRTIVGTCCAYFLMWVSEPFISSEYLMFSILFVLTSRIDVLVSYYYDDYIKT